MVLFIVHSDQHEIVLNAGSSELRQLKIKSRFGGGDDAPARHLDESQFYGHTGLAAHGIGDNEWAIPLSVNLTPSA